MGLLDSNKVKTQELEKTGVFNLDLAATASQNNTNFNGVAYKTLKLIVSDIASDADVIIVVKAGISGNYPSAKLYDSRYNTISTGITKNGTYYVDVSCSEAYYFVVTRRLESGSATVKWCLTEASVPVNNAINSTLQSIAPYVIEQTAPDSSETFDLSAVADLKTVSTSDNYKCIAIRVSSISDGAKLGLRTTISSLVFYRQSGELTDVIDKADIYYIPVPAIYLNVTIRNTVAVTNGSASIKIGYLNEVPQDVVNMKPIQEIARATVAASNNSFTVIAQDAAPNIWKYFKYYFVSYVIYNGTAAVVRTVTLSAQPYFKMISGSVGNGNTEEISVSSNYAYTTAWQEVKGNYGTRLYMNFESYTDGDTVECHVFGVR